MAEYATDECVCSDPKPHFCPPIFGDPGFFFCNPIEFPPLTPDQPPVE